MITVHHDDPIGVFDSGIGGLTVLRALHRRLPEEATVYLGDTARVPYGTRSARVVERYALNAARFLLETAPLKMLVVACNTASAVALDALRAVVPVPVVGVVEPGASAAARASRGGRIAVIGTRGTVKSGAYQRALARLAPGVDVVARPCPLLVPLAEEGWTDGALARDVVGRYIGDLAALGVDTLLLGCTHYPLLADAIQAVVGPGVRLVDSAEATASVVSARLESDGLRAAPGNAARRDYYLTDVPDTFAEVAARFLGAPLEAPRQIDIHMEPTASDGA